MAQIKLAEYTFDNSVGDCLPTLTPNTITMTKEERKALKQIAIDKDMTVFA